MIADRSREHRSQIVFTRAGPEMVFWQSPRTRKQARPDVRVPTARAAGIDELEILVDAHERYLYRFTTQQVRTLRRGLTCGDYAVSVNEKLVAVVERKSLADLVSSLTSGRLRFALGELATLPRAAVVVEERYSRIFALERVRPAQVADGLAELQVRWPTIAIVFCENRKLAEEWTYRYLAAAHAWAVGERAALDRIGTGEDGTESGLPQPPPSTAEIRAWARRGPHRLRPRPAPPRGPPCLAGGARTLSGVPGVETGTQSVAHRSLLQIAAFSLASGPRSSPIVQSRRRDPTSGCGRTHRARLELAWWR